MARGLKGPDIGRAMATAEEEAYAADELVELCEAILNELAAIGFAVYLKQKNLFQLKIYN